MIGERPSLTLIQLAQPLTQFCIGRLPLLFADRRREVRVLVGDPADKFAHTAVSQKARNIHPVALQCEIAPNIDPVELWHIPLIDIINSSVC